MEKGRLSPNAPLGSKFDLYSTLSSTICVPPWDTGICIPLPLLRSASNEKGAKRTKRLSMAHKQAAAAICALDGKFLTHRGSRGVGSEEERTATQGQGRGIQGNKEEAPVRTPPLCTDHRPRQGIHWKTGSEVGIQIE